MTDFDPEFLELYGQIAHFKEGDEANCTACDRKIPKEHMNGFLRLVDQKVIWRCAICLARRLDDLEYQLQDVVKSQLTITTNTSPSWKP